MSVAPGWIAKRALLLLHEESLARFGGARGLRDEGLLDSALVRPQNILAYNPASTLAELAAAYAWGLSKNHPFTDGNKRAAFLSIGLFLMVNDYRLTAPVHEAIHMITSLAAGEVAEGALAGWIAANMQKI